MRRALITLFLALCAMQVSHAGTTQQVVDIPSRHGVTQRILLITPDSPRAAVILFAGGHGGLNIADDGSLGWGEGIFLMRARNLFAEQGLAVAIIDKPSDAPNLNRRRQIPEHAADVKAVMNWLRNKQPGLPVWLVGTSRGTQSAAYVAIAMSDAADGPAGLVLTSSMLADKETRPLPKMALDQIKIPALVVHHEQDSCEYSLYADVPRLMNKLSESPRKALYTATGGASKGDACEGFAYHGYNGIEQEVVAKIAAWISPQ